MTHPTSSYRTPLSSCCPHTGTLVGLDGVHVAKVTRIEDRLTLTIETPSELRSRRASGVAAQGHGRHTRIL